jgi:tetratricopeptide (TPR) repeat protein
MPTFNYGFRHTLPKERENLAVLSPASGFGGLGEAAGRIVEFNVSVGQGVAIAVAQAIAENRSLHTITHQEVRKNLGYTPTIYGRPTQSFHTVFLLEKTLRTINQVAIVATISPLTGNNLAASLKTAQTHFSRGVQHSEKGSYLAAVEAYTQAIASDPSNPVIYYNRGVALTRLHRYESAIADYTKAIQLKPDFVTAYKNRGLVYIQSYKHLKESVADYNQAIAMAPNDATSYLGKGLALSLQGKRQAAIESLRRATKLKHDLAIAYFTLASVYVDLGDRSTALTNYRKAASLYQQQGNQVGYQNTLGAIAELNQS